MDARRESYPHRTTAATNHLKRLLGEIALRPTDWNAADDGINTRSLIFGNPTRLLAAFSITVFNDGVQSNASPEFMLFEETGRLIPACPDV